MKLFQKIAAGLLLFIGLPISLAMLLDLRNPDVSRDDREGAWAALVFFGLPPTALGSWLIWNLRNQHLQAQREQQRIQEQQREQIFLQLLQEHRGEITILGFATEAKLSLAEAEAYLDEKAKQLDANFEPNDQGNIVYRFTL